MSRALVTAYAASAARVGSWLIVFGLVYRVSGNEGQTNLGILGLARATAGLLGYASLGITPVLVRLLAQQAADEAAARRTYATAVVLVLAIATAAAAALIAYDFFAGRIPLNVIGAPRLDIVFFAVAFGTLMRSASDVFASALLASGRIVTDNLCQIATELAFVLTAVTIVPGSVHPSSAAGVAFWVSAAVLLVSRGLLAGTTRPLNWHSVDPRLAWPILLLCSGVLAGQLADWLYAPLNQILIGHHYGETAVAPYAVAIQIDGGLLLLVGGLAVVMLPHAAISFQQDRLADLRRQYLQAWLGSLLLLAGASAIVVMLSAIIFERWFGNSMPAAQAVLPLVLIHTTIGGTAGVSRAVLLGIGRVKAYTLSAIIGGVTNAVLAYVLLTQTTLGIKGVIWATIATVFLRCGLWMPWYTLRCLRPNRLPSATASPI